MAGEKREKNESRFGEPGKTTFDHRRVLQVPGRGKKEKRAFHPVVFTTTEKEGEGRTPGRSIQLATLLIRRCHKGREEKKFPAKYECLGEGSA